MSSQGRPWIKPDETFVSTAPNFFLKNSYINKPPNLYKRYFSPQIYKNFLKQFTALKVLRLILCREHTHRETITLNPPYTTRKNQKSEKPDLGHTSSSTAETTSPQLTAFFSPKKPYSSSISETASAQLTAFSFQQRKCTKS